jgi:hypothetical protein
VVRISSLIFALFGLDFVFWRAFKDIALDRSKPEEKIAFGIATSGIMMHYKGLPPSTTPFGKRKFCSECRIIHTKK